MALDDAIVALPLTTVVADIVRIVLFLQPCAGAWSGGLPANTGSANAMPAASTSAQLGERQRVERVSVDIADLRSCDTRGDRTLDYDGGRYLPCGQSARKRDAGAVVFEVAFVFNSVNLQLSYLRLESARPLGHLFRINQGLCALLVGGFARDDNRRFLDQVVLYALQFTSLGCDLVLCSIETRSSEYSCRPDSYAAENAVSSSAGERLIASASRPQSKAVGRLAEFTQSRFTTLLIASQVGADTVLRTRFAVLSDVIR